MGAQQSQASGPDLTEGVLLDELADGEMLLGHVGEEAVLLARRADEVFAIGATCTHYGGPLGEGLLVEDTVRCPWHHACFSLRTGEALRPPALNPVPCWGVDRQGNRVVVREKVAAVPKPAPLPVGAPRSIVILGGGAAGNMAAETLRREGYSGALLMISADAEIPYDRPNLSKDYLAGSAPEEWIPLRSPEFYRRHDIELRLGARATVIDPAQRLVRVEDASLQHASLQHYDALLIATGAEPVRLSVPGGELPHVRYLRSLADSRAIIKHIGLTRRVVIVGASFIGLEVAASLRARNIEVRVVAPECVPMERLMGREIGGLVRRLHEENGVRFHLGTTIAAIEKAAVTLSNGETLSADLVVVGIGVRPALDLAEAAGLAIDRGVAVDAYLETSIAGIFAAGDIARWPDPHSGERIRVEHWVVAERQGQTAARNMIGRREPFDAVPFFWSMHYDTPILYVGHAEAWDEIEIDGRIEARDCRVSFRRAGRLLAVATIGRDIENLRAEVELERSQAGRS
jgi:NADPH-dependent 2,4-dienoyl-CoA reductase/sulfur reductase-like enzyme/nitrite reductase/ring-hydroxylating ferredoxin subunit